LEGERKSREEAADMAGVREVTGSEVASGKAQRGDTQRMSLRMFREGRTVAEIAQQRELNVSTVEGHLASFIFTGEVDIKEIVAEAKVAAIIAVIKEIGPGALGPIKSRLGDEYSFGEIRAAVSYFKMLGTR
jgi:uncharacterized protein YpbB